MAFMLIFGFLLYLRDFANKLSMAIISNSNSSLHGIDLSHNLIEDRGTNTFSRTLSCLSLFLSFCFFFFAILTSFWIF